MTKAELVDAVSVQTQLTKKSAAEIIDVVFNHIGQAVKADNRFSYPGFGTWTAIFALSRSSGFNGPIQYSVTTSDFTPFGSVSVVRRFAAS